MERLDCAITKDTLAHFVQLYRDGDEYQRDSLIAYHIKIVLGAVRWHSQGFSNHYDDLKSVALLALVHTIDSAPDVLYDNDITAYVCKSVNGAMLNYLKRLLTPVKNAKISNIKPLNAVITRAVKQYSVCDLDDLIQWLGLTPLESFIVRQRIKGLTLLEIGDKLGITEPTVSKKLKAIRVKGKKLL